MAAVGELGATGDSGEPDPEHESGQPVAWLPGPTRPGAGLLGSGSGAGLPGSESAQGVSWSWDLDFETLLEVLAEPGPGGLPGPAGEDAAEGADICDGGEGAAGSGDCASDPERAREIPLARVAGRVAERLAPGPSLAGWLGCADVAELDDYALTGVSTAFRRLTSWAQAGELAALAAMASRAAAADEKVGVSEDGRPAGISEDAVGEASLALSMSRMGATAWIHLAATLRWRLPATLAALSVGEIDLGRARIIAELTGPLDDEKARTVEAKVLPGAGSLTMSQLRARTRRVVILADPQGAEQRREQAERAARVSLYPDENGTATLAGQSLPSPRAAAAMARITALAKAMKAAGVGGGIDLLRAKVFTGLLLGTLPYIPPADGAPPDGGTPPGGGTPSGGGDDVGDHRGDSTGTPESLGGPGGDGPSVSPWDGFPDPRDDDAPGEDGTLPDEPPGWYPDDDDDRLPGPPWPPLPPGLLPAPGNHRSGLPVGLTTESASPRADQTRPAPWMLDLTVPWATLAGWSDSPGVLGRIGPVTAMQVREMATAAATDPAVTWRVVVVNASGQAITVTPVPRARLPRAGHDPPRTRSPGTTALVSRITVVIPEDFSRQSSPRRSRATPLGHVLDRALRAAETPAERARPTAATAAAGACAHTRRSRGYRPGRRLREHVIARDVTCRFPPCGQPAWLADLDHTQPFDQGGPTCDCNLGGGCRGHHRLKQRPGWALEQPEPGVFTWITPSGRSYTTLPDPWPV